MSQRGYKIEDDICSSAPTFSLVMAWEALEPYVLNAEEYGIDTFNGAYARTMAIDIDLIKKDIENKCQHAMKHNDILRKICDESTRDISLYDIG